MPPEPIESTVELVEFCRRAALSEVAGEEYQVPRPAQVVQPREVVEDGREHVGPQPSAALHANVEVRQV